MSHNPRTASPRRINARPSRSRLLSMLSWVASVTLTATAVKGQTCAPHWSDEFPNAGLNSFVRAITDFDDGSGQGPALYIGGHFSQGEVQVLNHVARLDSANGWASLGEGVDGVVRVLTTFDDGLGNGEALYAGGSFTKADGASVSSIAKWDGQTWSPLGEGTDGFVDSLAVFDDGSGPALYVGGYFSTAGGASANNIARWNGQTWSALGGGTDTLVRALAVFDDGSGPALYAGGSFTEACDISANHIAKWDGQTWSPLGAGINGSVYALTVFDDGSGDALFASGSFDQAGGIAASNIAKWDGESWSPVGGGTDGLTDDLCVFDDGSGSALYAGGFFEEAGNMQVRGIARWDGESWSPLGHGVYDSAWVLAVYDDGSEIGPVLCVGGSISIAGFLPAGNFAQWDGNEWSTAGGGLVNYGFTAAWALATVEEGLGLESGLYVGGNFKTAGGVEAASIARWDGESFSSVGGGIDDTVLAMAVFDEDGTGSSLFAGGGFSTAGGKEINSVARWNGNSWSQLGGGISGVVYALTVLDDSAANGPALYAGGTISQVEGNPVNRIAKWDGTEWSDVGGGTNDWVYSLTAFDDGSGAGSALYAGGRFTMAGGVDANFIAKWDGVQWSPLGSGMDSTVRAMAAYDDGTGLALYAGGYFATAGGVEANGIAKWDGKEWSALPGGGISGPGFPSVQTLAVFDDGISSRPALYIGGRFEAAGGIDANHLVRWDGKMWSPLTDGLEVGFSGQPPTALAMEVFDDGSGYGPALFVTGDFLIAGGISSQHIAKWIVCVDIIPGDLDGDGSVGVKDLLILLGNWGPCADCNDCIADLDDDCTVGVADLLILLGNWG